MFLCKIWTVGIGDCEVPLHFLPLGVREIPDVGGSRVRGVVVDFFLEIPRVSQCCNVEKSGGRDWRQDKMVPKGIPGEILGDGSYKRGQSSSPLNNNKTHHHKGWEPTCNDPPYPPVPCTVLDPFSGSGTTGFVAVRHQRNYLGIDLNPQYLPLAAERIMGEKGCDTPNGEDVPYTEEDLFGCLS